MIATRAVGGWSRSSHCPASTASSAIGPATGWAIGPRCCSVSARLSSASGVSSKCIASRAPKRPTGSAPTPWRRSIRGPHGTRKARSKWCRTQLARRRFGVLSRAMNDAVSIARDLVRCPSVTPADAGALGVLENILKAAGFDVHRVTFGEPGTADIDKLYARIGDSAPHISFAGHTDVVPPGDESAWSHGAFSGDVKDGILYGR